VLQGKYDKLLEEASAAKELADNNITLLSDMLNQTQTELEELQAERQHWKEEEKRRKATRESSQRGSSAESSGVNSTSKQGPAQGPSGKSAERSSLPFPGKPMAASRSQEDQDDDLL